ncbi:MAG: DsrE family protein [Myxococcales bacterium]|nr:DsrE family protein [Myxococcales bacterium]
MSKKSIVVSFHRAPFGTAHYHEGLRVAVGLGAGTDEHSVSVVFQGEAVYYALKSTDRTDTKKYLEALRKAGVTPWVEEEALAARGLRAEELSEDIRPIRRAQVLEMLRAADVNIDL